MFYFAWVDATETTFDPVVHRREDEQVYELEIDHDEGDYPALTIDIKNPKRSFIDPSFHLWVWLSDDDDALYFGRLTAAPEDITDEIVRLTFVSCPEDFIEQKIALANEKKVPPFYDEIWIREDRVDDPNVVLEAIPELWHVDRITLLLTTSHILRGEDGTIVFDTDSFFYSSLRINYGAAPLRHVRVEAELSWDQVATGELDITKEVVDAFHEAGSTSPDLISSFTGQGLEADWPEPLLDLNGGWFINYVSLQRADGVWVTSRHFDTPVVSPKPVNDDEGAKSQAFFSTPYNARFYLWEFKPVYKLGYNVSRQRIERVTVDLYANVQPMVIKPGESEFNQISVASRRLSEPLEDGGALPIGDRRRNAFLPTERGRRALEYLIMLARARAQMRARAVNVTIAIPFAAGKQLSLRKSAVIIDSRFQNGQVAGKIISYRLGADGDGNQWCELTIGCSIGYGNTLEQSTGEPEYADEEYTEEYQRYIGSNFMPVAGELTYEDYTTTPIEDDGIDFFNLKAKDVINRLEVVNGESVQRAVLEQTYPDPPAVVEALNAVHTEVILELEPLVGGPFETRYHIELSELELPQTIAL